MAQAIPRHLHTAKSWVQSQDGLYGICGGQIEAGSK
jgi:hypothetical protein